MMLVPGAGTRRALLGSALSLTGATALTALTGCRSDQPPVTAPRHHEVDLPEFVEFSGVAPELPAVAEGAPTGHTSYPVDPVPTVRGEPLAGDAMRLMTTIFDPVPTSKARNAAWQAIEEALGGSFDLTIVPDSDYSAKFQTTVAGGDLPDAMFLASWTIRNLPHFLEATCADLTPYLSGDAVHEFPNLAAIPTRAWAECVTSDRIYGLPIPRGITGGAGFVNVSLLDEAGVDIPASVEDYCAVCREVTSERADRYAIVNQKGNTFLIPLFLMHGVPYNWRLDGDDLVKDYETEEYVAALEVARGLVADGVVLPGSNWIDGQTRKGYFKQGRGAFVYDGLPAFGDYRRAMRDQDVQPFVPTGARALAWADNIVFGQTVLKQTDEGHLRNVLHAANFFAAPFGTAEHLLLNFGVEGVDHVRQGGLPTLTGRGERDLTAPWEFFVAPAQAVFDPDPDFVVAYHGALSTMIPMAVEDPVADLISPTAAERGFRIDRALTDVRDAVVAGRRPLSDWAPAVARWRADGGDRIREEYQVALSARAG